MNPRNTGLLLLITVALGAFLYFYEVGGEAERKAAEQAESNVYPGLTSDDITRIELIAGDGTPAVVERSDTGWRLREPVDFRGDQATLDGMSNTLAGLTSEAVIDDPQDAGVYGLGDGAEVVRFTAGGESRVLRVGSKTPVGANSYAAREGDTRVFIVPTWRFNSLRKEVLDLRERKVLDFDPAAIEALEARWRGGSVSLAKRDDGWWVTAPLEGRADDEVVGDLLSDLAFLRADGFEDDPRPDSESGLDDPEFFASLVRAGETEAEDPVRFALGSLIEGGERLARGASPGVLYEVPGDRLAEFPRELVSYRFKNVATFAEADARRIELSFVDGDERASIEGVLENGTWTTSPESMDTDRLTGLISEVSRLKAIDILADEASDEELSATGLAPPDVAIRILPEAGEEPLAELHIGALDAKGVAVRIAGERQIFRLDLKAAEHIPVSLGAFRNRFLEVDEVEAPADGENAGVEAPAASVTPPE